MKNGDTLSNPASPRLSNPVDSGYWRLPSGQLLADFALRAGFAAPSLLWRFPLAPAPYKPSLNLKKPKPAERTLLAASTEKF